MSNVEHTIPAASPTLLLVSKDAFPVQMVLAPPHCQSTAAAENQILVTLYFAVEEFFCYVTLYFAVKEFFCYVTLYFAVKEFFCYVTLYFAVKESTSTCDVDVGAM